MKAAVHFSLHSIYLVLIAGRHNQCAHAFNINPESWFNANLKTNTDADCLNEQTALPAESRHRPSWKREHQNASGRQ